MVGNIVYNILFKLNIMGGPFMLFIELFCFC